MKNVFGALKKEHLCNNPVRSEVAFRAAASEAAAPAPHFALRLGQF